MSPADKLVHISTYLFDPLHFWWEKEETQKRVATFIIIAFLVWLSLIELKRNGLLSANTPFSFVPNNPFYAVHLAFSLLLVFEVVTFIFILPCSVTKAVAMQLEILSLIFLRNCFKLLIEFNEPVDFSAHLELIYQIAAYSLGALTLFGILAIYHGYVLRSHIEGEKLTRDDGLVIYYFVGFKKAVSLILILIFLGMGIYNLYAAITNLEHIKFFREFYTILIFSDILIVLISHRFFPSFKDIFRNSGYAIATLLMRLCLTAPPYYDVFIGVFSAAFAFSLSYLTKKTETFF